MITALGVTDVPVPETYGLCTDDSVNGAPFYVMDFVEGLILRDEAAAAGLDEATRRHAGESLIDTLARLHDVDVAAVGLDQFGRHEGISSGAEALARPVHPVGGGGQARSRHHRPGPRPPGRRVPEQQGVGIVHGDYRLDNTVIGDDGTVRAILDWEICTLGDPLADLGLLLVYWTEPEDIEASLIGVGPTRLPGFSTRAELVARYAALSDRDLSAVPTTRHSASGSWAASSRGSTPDTRAGRRPETGATSTCSPSRSAGWASAPWPRWSRCDRAGHADLHDRPGLGRAHRVPPRGPGAGRGARGLGRRRAGRIDGRGRAGGHVGHHAGRHLRHRSTDRPAGPSSHRPAGQRDHHRAQLALHPGHRGHRQGRRRRLVPGRPEPDFRWKSFLTAVVELVQRLGVRMVVGLGAFPAPAPHTRPVRLASTVPPQSADLAGRVGFVQGTLEVPAGVRPPSRLPSAPSTSPSSRCGRGSPTMWRPCPSPRPARR